MLSEIKVGQRFKFNILSDNPSPERLAVVTRVLSNSEEGLGPTPVCETTYDRNQQQKIKAEALRLQLPDFCQ